MTYNEFIQNIIDTRGQWNIQDGDYYEMHHILPKCLGGEDDKHGRFKKNSHHPNCIWLYPKEHYIAHKLLFEENKDNRSLALAWHNFHTQRKDSSIIEISSEEYEELRQTAARLHGEYMSEKLKGENGFFYGKNPRDYGGGVKKGYKHTPQARLHMSNAGKGKKRSEKAKENMSKAQSGKKHPWTSISNTLTKKGKKDSQETRAKKSKAAQGGNNSRAKVVKCIETNTIYLCLKDAYKEFNSWNNGSIQSSCNDVNKLAFGYHWEYIDKD